MNAGQPFHVVHFDGHGGMAAGSGEGVLAFELPDGGSGYVAASRVAAALAAGGLPSQPVACLPSGLAARHARIAAVR